MSSTLVPSCISVQFYWWHSDVFLSPVFTAFSINTESNIHEGELFHNDECWSNTKTGLSIISFQQNMNSTFVVVLGCTHFSSLIYVEFCRNPKTMWVLYEFSNTGGAAVKLLVVHTNLCYDQHWRQSTNIIPKHSSDKNHKILYLKKNNFDVSLTKPA